jgi:transcription elongation factor GreA
MNNKPTYLSKDGLAKLRAELDEMVSVKRPEVANRIHDAKEHGDLSENAEYEDAKNEQAFVEGRIQTLEALIKNATLIDENHSTDHVQIGSTVSVESGDGKETFTIVGCQARRGSHLEREPGRPRAPWQEEGREGRGEGARGRLHVQDHEHQLTHWRPGSAPSEVRGGAQRRHRPEDAGGNRRGVHGLGRRTR